MSVTAETPHAYSSTPHCLSPVQLRSNHAVHTSSCTGSPQSIPVGNSSLLCCHATSHMCSCACLAKGYQLAVCTIGHLCHGCVLCIAAAKLPGKSTIRLLWGYTTLYMQQHALGDAHATADNSQQSFLPLACRLCSVGQDTRQYRRQIYAISTACASTSVLQVLQVQQHMFCMRSCRHAHAPVQNKLSNALPCVHARQLCKYNSNMCMQRTCS